MLEAVRWAAAEEVPLDVLGHGSKRGIGRPVQTDTASISPASPASRSTSRRNWCSRPRPARRSPTSSGMLAEHNQMLAFEPMDFGPLFGAARGRGTLGGVLASNCSGPRRIKAGAARDHVLGIKAVSGRGEAFKSGGRVVKNVTGYDLSKGLAGSWGTLAVVTEATFKVLPRPEAQATLVVAGLEDLIAVTALCKAMGTAARRRPAPRICPMPSRRSFPTRRSRRGGRAATLIRLEGFAPSVDYRAQKLTAAIGRLGQVSVLEDGRIRGALAGGARCRVLRRDAASGLAGQRRAERRADGDRRAQEEPRHPLFLRLVRRADLDRGERTAGRTGWRARSVPPSRRSAAAMRR